MIYIKGKHWDFLFKDAIFVVTIFLVSGTVWLTYLLSNAILREL